MIDLLNEALDVLSSQYRPLPFSAVYNIILHENGISGDAETRSALWHDLYNHQDVLMLIDDDVAISLGLQITGKKKVKSTVSFQGLPPSSLDLLMDKSRLVGSNVLRMQRLNLALYEAVVSNYERFQLLTLIASARFQGYWQHDLAKVLGLHPRNIFTLMTHLVNMSLVYKVTVPKNSVTRQLLQVARAESMYRLGNVRCGGDNIDGEDGGGDNYLGKDCDADELHAKDADLDDESPTGGVDVGASDRVYDEDDYISSVAAGGVVGQRNTSVAICFHHKYFIIDKLPDYIKTACFKSVMHNAEASLLKVLSDAKDGILLEEDFRNAYYNLAAQDLGAYGQPQLEQKLVHRSYITTRRALETKNKIKRVFAWCTKSQRFEICVSLAHLNVSEISSSVPDQSHQPAHSMELETFDGQKPDTASEITPILYQSPLFLNGHSMPELIYNITRCHNGITLVNINKYMGLKYKCIVRMMQSLETSGLIKKESSRSAKVFMYLYYASGLPKPSSYVSKRNEHVTRRADEEDVVDDASTDSKKTISDGKKSASAKQSGYIYYDFMISQRDICNDGQLLAAEYKRIYGTRSPPKHLDTLLFRRRMVLVYNYIVYTKASTVSTTADFCTRVQDETSRVDRKTILRTYEVGVSLSGNIMLLRSADLEGVKNNFLIFYDANQINDMEAYNVVMKYTHARRLGMPANTVQLKHRINTCFKSLDDYKNRIDTVQAETDADLLKIGVDSPRNLVATNVVVAPTGGDVSNLPFTTSFSQKSLGENGYIFPVVTRMKRLHSLLLDNFADQVKFISRRIIDSMTLEQYLNIVGFGLPIPQNYQWDVKATMKSLPRKVYNFYCGGRGKRNCIFLLHKTMTIMCRLGLLEIDQDEGIVYWTLKREVLVGKGKDALTVDVFQSPQQYWQTLEGLVSQRKDVYNLPREVLNKKNWKMMLYLNENATKILEKTIMLWIRLVCCDMSYSILLRNLHLPQSIINLLMKRYNINQKILWRFVSNKIKIIKAAHSPQVSQSQQIETSRSSDFRWLGSFVLAERCCNAIILDAISDAGSNKLDEYQGPNFIMEHGVWNYMSKFFQNGYTTRQCRDYIHVILGRSPFFNRILLRLRSLDAGHIYRYATEGHVPLINVYQNSTTLLDPMQCGLLKSIVFTPKDASTFERTSAMLHGKLIKPLVSEWLLHGWLIKHTDESHGKCFITSNLVRLKLFGKCSTFLQKSDMLCRCIEMSLDENSENRNMLNLDSTCIDVLLEMCGKEFVEFDDTWGSRDGVAKKQKLDNLLRPIDGGISKHINVLCSDPGEVSRITARVTNTLGINNEEACKYNLKTSSGGKNNLYLKGSNVLNPLTQAWQLKTLQEREYNFDFDALLKCVAGVYGCVNGNVDEIITVISVTLRRIRAVGASGIPQSILYRKGYNTVLLHVALIILETLGLVVGVPQDEDLFLYFWIHAKAMLSPMERPSAVHLIRPEYISMTFWLRHQHPCVRGLQAEDLKRVLGPLETFVAENESDHYIEACNRGYCTCFTTINGDFNTQFYAFVALRIHDLVCRFPFSDVHQIWQRLLILAEYEVACVLDSLCKVGALECKPSETHGRTLYYCSNVLGSLWIFKDVLLSPN